MSKTIRKTKTREKSKTNPQFGVADLDPADLDVRQTRGGLYTAKPPEVGVKWKDRVPKRKETESPDFISNSPDMSTDEALEIQRKLREEVKNEDSMDSHRLMQIEESDTIRTVTSMQQMSSREKLDELKRGLDTSGVISFPKYEKQLEIEAAKEKKKEGLRVPFSSAADRDLTCKVEKVAPLTYENSNEFDKILGKGDELSTDTYSYIYEPSEKDDSESLSFVILQRQEEMKEQGIYQSITQDLKEIMPKEIYLPLEQRFRVSERKPKLWVKETPIEHNPAVIITVEEWEQEFGTINYAVEVVNGIIYAIKGSKWDPIPKETMVGTEDTTKGTPMIGPVDQTVETPDSKRPIPVAESTRKDTQTYTNTRNDESLPRSTPVRNPEVKTPRKKLEYNSLTDEEDDMLIQREIQESMKADQDLRLERDRIEKERATMLDEQQRLVKEKLIALRQQRKRLEESIQQMSAEMVVDSDMAYQDRLTRRNNLLTEYQNQIGGEDQLVEEYLKGTKELRDVTLETMTTDSIISSTADMIDFQDENSMMKIKIKQIRAEQCKDRSVKLYHHFIEKAKKMKKVKEKEELEGLFLATMKNLDRKINKYKNVLSSYDVREKTYYDALRKTEEERVKKEFKSKEQEMQEKKRIAELELEIELEKAKKQRQMVEEKKIELQEKIQIEKEKQIEKLKRLNEEKDKLRKLQEEKKNKELTEAFLEKERQQREKEEQRLTTQFLEEERMKEKNRQKEMTRKLLEKEKEEIRRKQEEQVRTKERKKRGSKPTTAEQVLERQKLLETLNDVVKNGRKPSKVKDLGWDYESDKKAQAIFGKINKKNGKKEKDEIQKCPKCKTLKHKGDCPCLQCGQVGHQEQDCPSLHVESPPKVGEQEYYPFCTCCKSVGHTPQECPWAQAEDYQIPPSEPREPPRICSHCRALDHDIRDCPTLKITDERRRKTKCLKCGEMGHDEAACLDETNIRIEQEIRDKIAQREKELKDINKLIHKTKRTSKRIGEPHEAVDPESKRERTKQGKPDPPKGKKRKISNSPPPPDEPVYEREYGNGGGPPDDPGDSGSNGDDSDENDDDEDDEKDKDDENEEEREENEESEDDVLSENSDGTEISGMLYDVKGRKVDIEHLYAEWQNKEKGEKPVNIVRGPRGYRGARGKPGKKGNKGDQGPTGSFTSTDLPNTSVKIETTGLEDSFRQLGNSMDNVWQTQRNLNTSMRDHIQLSTEAQAHHTDALRRLNESTRQRDHDHMFVSIEIYDGTDPKKFDVWIEQIEIACRISGRDPRVVALAKSTGAVTEVIRSLKAGLTWTEFKNELKRCFSESKTRVHAAAIFENYRRQDDNENLRSYIHKYSKLHREATGKACESQFDTQVKLHFLSRLRNNSIAAKISQSVEFEDFDNYSLNKCMEKALLLESRLQIREMVTQARENLEGKTPEVLEVDSKPTEITEEVNNIPEDRGPSRSKANSICYKCGNYGHYGKECTIEDKDLEDFADRIVGRIEHTFQAYTPITLQYMNDIIAKAAKIDQSRRIAKTKARLLQGMLNQKGGVPPTPANVPNRGRGRGNYNQNPQTQPKIYNGNPNLPVRGRGRGRSNYVQGRGRGGPPYKQANPAPPLQPTAPPAPPDPIKLEPNPFTQTLQRDAHLPEIQEVGDDEIDEELEGLTIPELEALQQAVDQEIEKDQLDYPEEEPEQ